MNRVFLLLGSNIAKEDNLPAAITLLHAMARVISLSSVYESVPMGLKEQPNFFNLAALIETDLDPVQIKQQIIQPIEIELRRQRQADKNAPRTIDVDIILYNEEIIDYTPDDGQVRHIPDPDLLHFAHVAVPVAEIAPDKRHPETGQTLADIATQLLAEVRNEGVTLLWKREDILGNPAP
ncbi:MAG: 2-amino-4-hydroxy-6-hydroxymethyldihydropteridine diphosphokinase [Chloroflexi bacterium]|jgi:2-amino-4-hydroxy-6-hydroxymethyldihydropteridine diphosphokinase|nr:2-amino-4-hydroxy-6-hydroxymethyldihydropteridine diphosphokinase [Chloroflexota bacterium]